MRLRKRVENLELLQKQNTCNHSFWDIVVENPANSVKIKSICIYCKKEITRTGTGEICTAAETLRNFLLEGRPK